jgi:carboxy-terminal domain RNA polymerase II polypeptide A small phosphatase
MENPILLILDLDETLIHASEVELETMPDFCFSSYYVYKRAHLEEFLLVCSKHFNLAVWSSGSADYVRSIVERIVSTTINLTFVWDYARCTTKIDPDTGQRVCLKDLKKLKRKGYSLERVLFVENDPRAVQRHYGNAIYVKSFCGEPDDELRLLGKYLKTLVEAPDVRRIEKRSWRNSVKDL